MDAMLKHAALPTSRGQTGSSIFSDGFESASTPQPTHLPPFAVRILSKAAYGPRPNDVATFNALPGGSDDARLDTWLSRQLNPTTQLPDTACTQRINAANYTTLAMTLPQMWSTHVRGSTAAGGPGAWPRRYYPCEEAACIKLIRAVYSERQLFEVMVDFWHTHFNVQGWEFGIAPVFMHYDRDVMRGTHAASGKLHALGNFRALLEQVAKAPAMLMYLDNKSSRGAGFNENFARELCELHTLGAAHYYPTNDPAEVPLDGNGEPLGYCDNDVYEAARALTGWTLKDNQNSWSNYPVGDTGEYVYYAPWHDTAGKFFLGQYLVANRPAEADGKSVLDLLCRHRGTALHLARKLCRRFIGDNPPEALVESAAAIWKAQWQAPDQIAQVLQHILSSQAFKTTWGEKTKRPWETLMHALRASSAEITPRVRPVEGWDSYTELTDRLQQTGNGPFRWPTPDGYPDHSSKWQAVSPLSQTWRTLSRLVEMRTPGAAEADATSYFMQIEQVTRSAFPTPATATAGAVVDFWINRFHGYPINSERRSRVVTFLAQKATLAQAETTQLTWATTWSGNNLSNHYTLPRLRAAIALLVMCPEFYQR